MEAAKTLFVSLATANICILPVDLRFNVHSHPYFKDTPYSISVQLFRDGASIYI